MAKKIKFNLQVNGVGISSLEGLQDNFNIEDIMEHFKSGLLMRWLEVQGLENELEKINKLNQSEEKDNFALAQRILEIFDMDKELDKNALKITLADINHKEYKEKLLKENENLDKNAKAFLKEYHAKFNAIIWDIIMHNKDAEKIKSNLKIIEKDYFDLFLLHFQTIVSSLKNSAPLALLFGLGTTKIRSTLLAYINIEEASDETGNLSLKDYIRDSALDKDTIKYLESIDVSAIDYLSYGYFEAISEAVYNKLAFDSGEFADVIKVFKGSTDGLWRDMVARNKKVLVLKISGSAKASKIPNDGETNEALGEEEINGKFLILDGLNFQSSADSASIEYVEL